MSDFVTAPKIWLSILIRIYCDGSVQEQDHTRYLSFITSYLLPGLATGQSGQLSKGGTQVNLDTIQEQLEPLETYHAIEDGTNGDSNLWLTFVFHACRIVHLDELGKTLCNIDVMRVGRAGQRSYSKTCTLKPNSLLGAFLKRLQLSWAQMPFENQTKVWSDYAGPRSNLEKRYAADFNQGLESELVTERAREADTELEESLRRLVLQHNENQQPSTISGEDLDTLLHYQTERMESKYWLIEKKTIC